MLMVSHETLLCILYFNLPLKDEENGYIVKDFPQKLSIRLGTSKSSTVNDPPAIPPLTPTACS